MKAVVYTAAMGNYHTGLQPLLDVGCDAIAYTDGKVAPAAGWEMRHLSRAGEHPRLAAKWAKLHPHILFPDYDLSIWLDAGWRVTNADMVRDLVGLLADSPLAFFPHRWRDSIYPEADATLEHAKYAGLPIREQVAHYKAQGYPDTLGLMECTMLVRRHNDPAVMEFDRAWWAENVKWTICDQLSCPVVAWQHDTPYTWLPYTPDSQPWVRIANWRADI